MKFEELQQKWDSIECEPRSDEELRRMMYSNPAWRFRRITEREFFGLCMVVVTALILIVDGVHDWKTEVVLIWGTLSWLSQYFGWHYLKLLPQKETIRQTLIDGLTRVKRLALISSISSVLTWIALALILGLSAHVGMMDIILWALMLLPLVGAVTWWNARAWKRKMEEVRAMLKEFDDEPVPSF